MLVGIGGALGSMMRHAVNVLVQRSSFGGGFPYSTFVVNIVGSAVIGLLAGLIAGGRLQMSTETRTFIFVGILGGFTTFSSFSLDTLTLARTGHTLLAVGNAASQVGLGMLVAVLGFRLGLVA